MIKCWIDGATDKSNPSQVLGSGSIIRHEFGDPVQILTKTNYTNGTNNLAEYIALTDVLEYFIDKGGADRDIVVYTDSQLLNKQMSGLWKIKEGCYVEEALHCKKLLEKFDNITIKWIPREQNTEADLLSKQALNIDF